MSIYTLSHNIYVHLPQGLCLPCQSGSFASVGGRAECAPCPAAAQCPGRHIVVPEPGFYASGQCTNDPTTGGAYTPIASKAYSDSLCATARARIHPILLRASRE